jgi:hypothetical protein
LESIFFFFTYCNQGDTRELSQRRSLFVILMAVAQQLTVDAMGPNGYHTVDVDEIINKEFQPSFQALS